MNRSEHERLTTAATFIDRCTRTTAQVEQQRDDIDGDEYAAALARAMQVES